MNFKNSTGATWEGLELGKGNEENEVIITLKSY